MIHHQRYNEVKLCEFTIDERRSNHIKRAYQICISFTFMPERTDPTQKMNRPFYSQYRAAYEYASQFIQAKSVLDVGCGEGYGACLLARQAKKVVAIDRNKKTIQQAKRRYPLPNLSFDVQDVERFSEGFSYSFDVICCFHVIEHLKEPGQFLENIGKLLSESGILLISTPNRHSPFRCATGFEWPYHEREYTVDEFHDLLSTYFKNVTLYALHACEKVQQFQDVRAQYIQQIFRWDILSMRRWLPKRLLQLSFDIGGKVLKSFMNANHGGLISSITVSDFHVTEKQTNKGLDLIGVCKNPQSYF